MSMYARNISRAPLINTVENITGIALIIKNITNISVATATIDSKFITYLHTFC